MRAGVGLTGDQRYPLVLAQAFDSCAHYCIIYASVYNRAGKFSEHLDRIGNRISLGELVHLRENAAGPFFRQQHSFGGGGSSIYADESLDLRAWTKSSGNEGLMAVLFLELTKFLRISRERPMNRPRFSFS